MIPTNPTAEQFSSFMTEVWDGKMEPTSEGGVVLYGHPLYDEWHNARKAVARLGGPFLYPTRYDGVQWRVYRMAENTKIAVAPDGNAIRVINRKDKTLREDA